MPMTNEQRHQVDDATRQVFAELAQQSGAYAQRWCVDVPNPSDRGCAVRHKVEKRLGSNNQFVEQDFSSNEFLGTVRGRFFDYLSSGLIVLSGPTLGDAHSYGWFHFTERGLHVLAGGSSLLMTQPGSLRAALTARTATGVISLEPYELDLLAEAQDCWQRGLFRAAAVLMGLANESRCLALIDGVCGALPAPTSADRVQQLNAARKESSGFTARWRPALQLLEGCRDEVRSHWHGQPWRQAWEGVPGVLETLGEAVRLTRNTAAHEPHQVFGRADVALLLAGMPDQIERIEELRMFFAAPPIRLPTL